uniref:Uncharacterized protein n=1 Tax=Romanomermis culicivorax TaxID=13658 RepID=A0A915K033_ROMCU
MPITYHILPYKGSHAHKQWQCCQGVVKIWIIFMHSHLVELPARITTQAGLTMPQENGCVTEKKEKSQSLQSMESLESLEFLESGQFVKLRNSFIACFSNYAIV